LPVLFDLRFQTNQDRSLSFAQNWTEREEPLLVNPNSILTKIQQVSWWARSLKYLAHQDTCCENHQFNSGIYREGYSKRYLLFYCCKELKGEYPKSIWLVGNTYPT